MGDHLRIEILQKLKMNGFVSIALLLALVASAQAFFYDPATGVFSLLANSQTLANGLVLTSGTTTAYLTSAGIAVGGLGLWPSLWPKSLLLKEKPVKPVPQDNKEVLPKTCWLKLTTISNKFPLWMSMIAANCWSALWKL